MSKRFGRNQRRRLRAELDVAQQESLAAAALAARGHRDLEDIRARVRYAFDAISALPDSGLRPPEICSGDPDQSLRLQVDPRDCEEVHFNANDLAVRCQPIMIQQLMRVEFALDYQREQLAHLVHVIVEGHGRSAGRWCYQASDLRLRAGLPRDVKLDFARWLVDQVDARAFPRRKR